MYTTRLLNTFTKMEFPGLISINCYRTDTLLGVANSLGTQKVLESFESMKKMSHKQS